MEPMRPGVCATRQESSPQLATTGESTYTAMKTVQPKTNQLKKNKRESNQDVFFKKKKKNTGMLVLLFNPETGNLKWDAATA